MAPNLFPHLTLIMMPYTQTFNQGNTRKIWQKQNKDLDKSQTIFSTQAQLSQLTPTTFYNGQTDESRTLLKFSMPKLSWCVVYFNQGLDFAHYKGHHYKLQKKRSAVSTFLHEKAEKVADIFRPLLPLLALFGRNEVGCIFLSAGQPCGHFMAENGNCSIVFTAKQPLSNCYYIYISPSVFHMKNLEKADLDQCLECAPP